MMADRPPVAIRRDGAVALLLLDSPPVNALGHAVRAGLARALAELRADATIEAVVLAGSETMFSGGADIAEFSQPPAGPSLREVIAAVEGFPKPVVAAIGGTAFGGGLELALACHGRIAWPNARLGLPEVKLGLLPGAGGTQRLPRLAGVGRALDMIVSGDAVSAADALRDGIVDAVAAGPFPAEAIAQAHNLTALGVGAVAPVRARDARLAAYREDPGLLDREAAPLLRRRPGSAAAKACVEAVRASLGPDFDAGLAEERRLFEVLRASPDSQAQRHAFFAEREARKVPGLGRDMAPHPVGRVVVIGAGTMGGGIAMSLAEAGIAVTLVESDPVALERGRARIAANYAQSVGRGSLDDAMSAAYQALIAGALTFEPVAEADLVIEAAFEDMAVKQEIFATLDRLAKPGAVLATNTSYLDIDAIAAVTGRAGDVLGMHFFSPANVMKLLEVVRGARTSPQALATALALGRRIGKVAVVVGVCHGFVGNRMLAQRSRQAERLLLEGAWPAEVDRALTDFGFRMGPFAMADLAGLDIGWRVRKATGATSPIADALCEAGRFGQKTGRGYYLYEGRTAAPDPAVEEVIAAASAREGLVRRSISQTEILERLLYPMINEGARILEEGIAARAGDIDVIWLNGYNWPAWRGGPMWYARHVGLSHVRDRLAAYAAQTGNASLEPAPLLVRLAGGHSAAKG